MDYSIAISDEEPSIPPVGQRQGLVGPPDFPVNKERSDAVNGLEVGKADSPRRPRLSEAKDGEPLREQRDVYRGSERLRRRRGESGLKRQRRARQGPVIQSVFEF